MKLKKSMKELPIGYKLKKAAVNVALDITLTRMHRSPKRCARNLLELGMSVSPQSLSQQEQENTLKELLTACKNKDSVKVHELFQSYFLL